MLGKIRIIIVGYYTIGKSFQFMMKIELSFIGNIKLLLQYLIR